MNVKLSLPEISALKRLKDEGGIIITKIPDKNETEFYFDRVISGMGVYKKLIKKELCFITEEEPFMLDDGSFFDFTPMMCLTEQGEKLVSEIIFPF